jgi:hypothetical protein
MTDEVRVSGGNRRRVQVIREGARKRFDAKRQAVFLEWFAATCNVALSAEKAGVSPQTVFKRRMRDPAFAADWQEAIAQGYARLEAELLRAATASAGAAPAEDVAIDALPTVAPAVQLGLLKEHNARKERPDSPATRARRAQAVGDLDEAQLRAALVKRLVVFGMRVRGE